MRVVLLAGGTGGTKLAHGFALLGERVDLTVVANVGDDLEFHGLHVSPDLDALLYTLSGLVNAERGWGIDGDTHTAHAMLGRLGAETWFTLGDADIATAMRRTQLLRDGASLTDATAALAAALGLSTRLLPATDDRLRTVIETDDGALDFQDYFVRRGQEPTVRGIRFSGADSAQPPSVVRDALTDAELIVVGPSNPIVSIGPILAVPGIADLIRAADVPRIAVSPIIGGRALKGPADRMLASLGHEASAVGVARLYAGLVDRFVVDLEDATLIPDIEALGMRASALPTVMRADEDRRRLAEAVVGLA